MPIPFASGVLYIQPLVGRQRNAANIALRAADKLALRLLNMSILSTMCDQLCQGKLSAHMCAAVAQGVPTAILRQCCAVELAFSSDLQALIICKHVLASERTELLQVLNRGLCTNKQERHMSYVPFHWLSVSLACIV